MSTDDNPYMVMKNAFNMKTFKPYCLKNVHQIHEFVSSIANASKDIYKTLYYKIMGRICMEIEIKRNVQFRT